MKGVTPGPMLFEQDIAADMVTVRHLRCRESVAAAIIWLPLGTLGDTGASTALQSIDQRDCGGLHGRAPMPLITTRLTFGFMVSMGLVALMLRRHGFPLAQVVLGMVLGPILEQHFMVSAIKSNWNLLSFFERPIAILLMVATIGTVLAGIRIVRRRAS